jgi:ABC-type lipoprotein release transport system permease subunit
MVKSSGRTLMGDVVVACPVSGIPHYARLITRLEGLSQVDSAAPVVDSWGLLRMPYPDGPDKQTETVQIWGIDERFARVTGYGETLHWRKVTQEQWVRLFADVLHKNWKDLLAELSESQRVALLAAALGIDNPPGATLPAETAVRDRANAYSSEQWGRLVYALDESPEVVKRVLTPEQWNALIAHDVRLQDPDLILKEGISLSHNGKSGIALGMHVSEGNERMRDGSYRPMRNGFWWMPAFDVTLTTLPVTGGSLSSEPESVILPVVNEFMSGVFLIDDKRVMIPLEVAQRLLHLNRGEVMDEADPTKVIGEDPARATMVLVRAAPGVTPNALRDVVVGAYNQFVDEIARDSQAIVQPPIPAFGLTIKTWEQQQSAFIGPVEKERELMRTLFSIVYLVCAALVLSIFWAIVYEKTRDIGILRSIGASRGGIVWIFLRYGLIVGVIGSIVGFGLAALVIRNINGIHETLGDPPLTVPILVLALGLLTLVVTIIRGLKGNLLPLVLGGLITLTLLGVGGMTFWLWRVGGVIIWNPEVYYFTRIPDQVDMATAWTTMVGAVVFSLLGAVIPAAKAADTDPVTALRYE